MSIGTAAMVFAIRRDVGGPDARGVPQLSPEAGSGVLFLVYTAGLMFVIRMWGSTVSHDDARRMC
jgi:hypothetical protein